MATRYQDAATVSDEHGKGAEILRQFTFHATVTGTHYFIPEVDVLIRSLIIHKDGSGNAATLAVSKRASGAGSTTSVFSATTLNAANAPRRVSTELLDAPIMISKGEAVEVVIGGTATAVTVVMGWLPNIWSADNNFRSYSTPS
jgi:hypothetical protein